MKIATKQFIKILAGIFFIHVSGAISYAITMEVGNVWWEYLVWPPALALGLFFILWFAKGENHDE